MAKNKSTVEVGGPYVEDENFVPNPTDIHGVYVTDGVGPHQDPTTISPIFDVDKAAVAQQVVDALDPESPVSASYVSLPEVTTGSSEARNEAAESLKAAAQATLDKGPVVVGEAPQVEKDAAETGDEAVRLAQAETAKNAGDRGVAAGDGGASATANAAGDPKTGDNK